MMPSASIVEVKEFEHDENQRRVTGNVDHAANQATNTTMLNSIDVMDPTRPITMMSVTGRSVSAKQLSSR